MKEFNPKVTHAVEEKYLFSGVGNKDMQSSEIVREFSVNTKAIREFISIAPEILKVKLEKIAGAIEELERNKKEIEEILHIRNEEEFWGLEAEIYSEGSDTQKREKEEDEKWADPKEHYRIILNDIQTLKNEFQELIQQN